MASLEDHNKANGARLSRLLIDKGTEAMRNVFDSIHPPASLTVTLNSFQNCLQRLPFINRRQMDILFPPSGAPSRSTDFDITLLFILLRNICGLQPPVSTGSWDDIPPSWDTSREANLARIKYYRNKVYGHITNTGVGDATFHFYWNDISAAVAGLGVSEGDVMSLKFGPLEENRYLDQIREWKENENIILKEQTQSFGLLGEKLDAMMKTMSRLEANSQFHQRVAVLENQRETQDQINLPSRTSNEVHQEIKKTPRTNWQRSEEAEKQERTQEQQNFNVPQHACAEKVSKGQKIMSGLKRIWQKDSDQNGPERLFSWSGRDRPKTAVRRTKSFLTISRNPAENDAVDKKKNLSPCKSFDDLSSFRWEVKKTDDKQEKNYESSNRTLNFGGKAKENRRLSKEDIGQPTNFRHVVHYSLETVLQSSLDHKRISIDDKRKTIYKKEDAPEEELQDPKNVKSVNDFVDETASSSEVLSCSFESSTTIESYSLMDDETEKDLEDPETPKFVDSFVEKSLNSPGEHSSFDFEPTTLERIKKKITPRKLSIDEKNELKSKWLENRKSQKHREMLQALLQDQTDTKKIGSLIVCLKRNFRIGSGSNGTAVFVGFLEDGSEVAVKRVMCDTDLGSSLMRTEKVIADLMKHKKSDHIVNYRMFQCGSSYSCIVLDLCEETLADYVKSHTKEHLEEHGPEIIRQILTGLQVLHSGEEKILHRDLKPHNVLVDAEGRMRLADFGISRKVYRGNTKIETFNAKGTEEWMSAETIREEEDATVVYGRKSDIYVVGMISFYVLTKGQHPFGKRYKRISNIMNGKTVFLENLNDPLAKDFVSTLISHDPDQRPYAEEALDHPFLKQTKPNAS